MSDGEEYWRKKAEDAVKHFAQVMIGVAVLVHLGKLTRQQAITVLRVPDKVFDHAFERVVEEDAKLATDPAGT